MTSSPPVAGTPLTFGTLPTGEEGLAHTSPDGVQGHPGEVTVTVTCTLCDDNALRIDYRATTTEPTVVNLTNHS